MQPICVLWEINASCQLAQLPTSALSGSFSSGCDDSARLIKTTAVQNGHGYVACCQMTAAGNAKQVGWQAPSVAVYIFFLYFSDCVCM